MNAPILPSLPAGAAPAGTSSRTPSPAVSSPFEQLFQETIRLAAAEGAPSPSDRGHPPVPTGHPTDRSPRPSARAARGPKGTPRRHRGGPGSMVPAFLPLPPAVPPQGAGPGGSPRGGSAPRTGGSLSAAKAAEVPGRSPPPDPSGALGMPVTAAAVTGKATSAVPPAGGQRHTTGVPPAGTVSVPPPTALGGAASAGPDRRPLSAAGAAGGSGNGPGRRLLRFSAPSGPTLATRSTAAGHHPAEAGTGGGGSPALSGASAWQVAGTVPHGSTPPAAIRSATGGSVRGHILNQVGKGLVRAASGGPTRVRLVLNPPTLGRVTLVVARRGPSVRAIVHVENPVVQDLVRSGLSELQGLLERQGSPPLLAQVLVTGTPPGQGFSGDGRGQQESRGRFRRVRLSSRVSRGGWRPLLERAGETLQAQKGGVPS